MAEAEAARDYMEIRKDYAYDPDIMNPELINAQNIEVHSS